MTKGWMAATALSALVVAMTVRAGEPPLPVDYRSLDTNHDNRLSLRELPRDSLLARRFVAFDSNRDGALDRSELTSAEQLFRRQVDAHPPGSPDQHHGLGPGLAPPVGYVNNGHGS